MNHDSKVLLGTGVVVLVLAPLLAGAAGWPVWSRVLLVAVLAGGFGLAAVRIRRRDAGDRMYLPPPAAPEPPSAPQACPVADRRLPSVEPDYGFLFSATVHFSPAPNHAGSTGSTGSTGPHGSPVSLAVDSILTRARQVTASEPPGEHTVAEFRLAAALGDVRPDPSGRVMAWARDVALTVPEPDAARLRTLSELRKQRDVWEQERGFERSMRDYLHTDALRTPGSAVVWWLARHRDKVEETARLIGTLAVLSATANDADPPDRFRALAARLASQDLSQAPPADPAGLGNGYPADAASVRVAVEDEVAVSVIDRLFPDPKDPERVYFGEHLGRLADRSGRAGLAALFRARLGAPDVAATEPAPTPNGSGDPDGRTPADPDDPGPSGAGPAGTGADRPDRDSGV